MQLNVNHILDRLKSQYGIKTETQLAKKLGVRQNTIGTWRRRNSLQIETLLCGFENVSPTWLLYGVGPVTFDPSDTYGGYSLGQVMELIRIASKIVQSDEATREYLLKRLELVMLPYEEVG